MIFMHTASMEKFNIYDTLEKENALDTEIEIFALDMDVNGG